MDIEEAKAKLEEYISIYEQAKCQIQPSEVKAIETVLSELEKKEKIIELMAEHLEKHSTAFLELYGANKKDWIEYFTNKVEQK